MFLERKGILHFKLIQSVSDIHDVLSVPLHHKYPLYCTDISSSICYQSCSTTDCTYSSLSITSAYHTCFLHSQRLRPCVWSVNCWLRNLKVDVTWHYLKPSMNYTHTLHSELQCRWGPRYRWLYCYSLNSYSMKLITMDGCGRYLEQRERI